MEIKQASLEMLEDIFQLEQLIWRDDSATKESLRKRIEIFPQGFCVVYSDLELVGMASSALLPVGHKVEEYDGAFFPWERIHDPNGKILYLFCSTVHPDFQRQGVWKQMLNFRIDYAKRHPEIREIWVSGRNRENEYGPNTSDLLERFGFRKIKDFLFKGHLDNSLLSLSPPYEIKTS